MPSRERAIPAGERGAALRAAPVASTPPRRAAKGASSRAQRAGAPAASTPLAPISAPAIGTQVEIHDQQQLEIRHDYAFGGDEATERYVVDSFFFVPKSVGVTPANYTREQFYADATALMRLDARKIPLAELADPACPRSPLHAFAEALEAFRRSRRPPPARPVVVHVKLYAHLFARAVKAEAKRLQGAIKAAALDDQALDAVEIDLTASLAAMRRALWSYRSLRSAFWPFENIADRSFAEAMRACDEYMSLVLEERLGEIAVVLDDVSAPRMAPAITALADAEVRYRHRYGYLTMNDEAKDGEYFTYRASVLKKTVQMALYLEPVEQNKDSFLRNAAGALGATLAAIWALIAQPSGSISTSSGVARVLIFAAAVGAYVLKDRIKALTNEVLTRRLRGFDRTVSLTGASLGAMGLSMLTAIIQERMRFVPEAEVPEKVRALRLSHQTVERADAPLEWVIQHRKVVEIGRKPGGAALPAGYCVRDILRLNVRHFLTRLDEAVDGVSYYDPARGRFQQASLPKVYHLNVVARIERQSGEVQREESLEHLRVVLNKRGIVRVEAVDG